MRRNRKSNTNFYTRASALASAARGIALRYGHEDIDPPIFEFTPVFARTMGEGSDVVRKEMYTFADRGGDELTLRP